MNICKKKLSRKLESRSLGLLFKQIQLVKNNRDLRALLTMILTGYENDLIIRRFIVADMLRKGVRYRDIQKVTDISQTTISKIRDILNKNGYGKKPGRNKALLKKPVIRKPLLGTYKGASSIL